MTDKCTDRDAMEYLHNMGQATKPASYHDVDGSTHIVIPDDYQVHTIPSRDPKLFRISQTTVLHDRDSMIGYVNRFKKAGTQIFAVPGFMAQSKQSQFVAKMDFHHDAAAPDHKAHTAIYSPRYSDAWSRWVAIGAKPITQEEFAEFIEDNLKDISEPRAGELLDIVGKLQLSSEVHYSKVVRQPNGDISLGYSEKTQQVGTSGPMPQRIELAIPVYFRASPYAVPVMIKYKLGAGQVWFTVKIDRADVVEDAAFKELMEEVRAGTNLEDTPAVSMYLGTAQ